MDPGLRYQALVNGEADVVVAFGTDGEISAFNLVLLQDDKGLFPPYQVAPVIRQDVLDANTPDRRSAQCPLTEIDRRSYAAPELRSQRQPA